MRPSNFLKSPKGASPSMTRGNHDSGRMACCLPVTLCLLLCSELFPSTACALDVFDMDAVRDPSTLEVDVLQEWRTVRGPVVTRQKLVTINVGEIWPGQDYRVPVRMVVPVNRKACGFHLTGGVGSKNSAELQTAFGPGVTVTQILPFQPLDFTPCASESDRLSCPRSNFPCNSCSNPATF